MEKTCPKCRQPFTEGQRRASITKDERTEEVHIDATGVNPNCYALVMSYGWEPLR